MMETCLPASKTNGAAVTEPPRPDPPRAARFVKTTEAAAHLALSVRTLEKHRCYGTGPIFRKLGGRVVYTIDDLDAWADLGKRRSTSDPGSGTVHPAKRQPRPVQS